VHFRTLLFSLLLFVAANGTVYPEENDIVTIMPSEHVVAAKGQTAQLAVTARIRKGFHIQANPAADEFLIPTTLTLEANEYLVPAEPVYPAGTAYRLTGSTEELLTYEDEVTIMLPVKVLDSAPAGNTSLVGKLHFQPCDERKCLFPRSVPVMIPIIIVHPQD
jgi:hypothetical protein